jgi:hypothetical protein
MVRKVRSNPKRIQLLRWLVFNIWFVSLLNVVLCFALSAILSPFASLERDYIKSATLLFGLITPPFGTMLAFYAARPDETRSFEASPEFFAVAIMCSVLYHVIFVALVVAGVIFLKLAPTLEEGALYRNCVFIVNWMGLLSVLLGPSVWLFARSQPAIAAAPAVEGKVLKPES